MKRNYNYNQHACSVKDLIDARAVYLILGIQEARGRLMDTWRFCNKLNKISSPSIDTSRPSRDPHRSFRSQLRRQNPHSGSLYCNSLPILSLNFTTEQDAMRKPLLIKARN